MKKNNFGILSLLLLAFNVNATELLVPAYFYPSGDPNLSYWDEMTAALSHISITAIMNPNSGPGASVNSDYTSAVNTFRAAGGKVIAYVPTGYGTRNQSDVLADVTSYKSFYNVDGIFLDEMSNLPSNVSYYQSIYNDIKTSQPSYRVFGNAGTNTLESYLGTADVLITFENQAGYNSYVPDAWTAHYSADHFAHLLYNVGSAAEMQADVALAVKRNAGYVYVTNDNGSNPWDTLPSYWATETSAVSAVPEPSSTLLFLLGLSFISIQHQYRKKVAIK